MSSDLPITAQPVLDLRFFLRTLRDYSGNGNHASVAGSRPYWQSIGQVDALGFLATGRLTVADSPELQGTSGTVLLAGQWLKNAVDAIMFSKRDAGGTQFELGTSSIAGSLSLYDGSAVRTAAIDYPGARTLAITWNSGEAAKAYKDGSFVADFSGVSTITVNDAPLIVGNFYDGSLPHPNQVSWVCFFPEVLSADELAALHAWWLNKHTADLRWPGMGYRYPRGRINIVADGDMEAEGVSSWAALGGALLTKSTSNPYQGAQSLQVEKTTASNPYARQTCLTLGKRYDITGRAWSDGNATPYLYCGGASADWIGTTDPGWQVISIENVKADGAFLALQAVGGAVGSYCRFDDIIISEINAPYEPEAPEPLFVDNLQTARPSIANEGGSRGQALAATDYLTSDSTGRWSLDEESNGRRVLRSTLTSNIHRRSLVALDATWIAQLKKSGDSSTVYWMPIATIPGSYIESGQDGYLVILNSSEQIVLYRVTNGGLATLYTSPTAYIDPTGEYEIKLQRSAAGVFSLWIRGGSFAAWTLAEVLTGANPVTDAVHQTSKYSTFTIQTSGHLAADRVFEGLV